MEVTIRELRPDDADAAMAVMRSLPEWFGHEGGLADCRRAVEEERGTALEDSGTLIAFATWTPRTEYAAEITWMAVHASRRGEGLGTRLIEHICTELHDQGGFRLALAMTSAAHKTPHPGEDPYDATRAFWLRRGFLPLTELDIWDTDIALLMVRSLSG